MLNVVFSVVRPDLFVASSTSFCSSRTAYSRVVRVSSTSSTINTLLPIRLAISRLLRSSHCVRVTLVPICSSSTPVPSDSYSERPMAWIGILGAPSRLRKDLWKEEEVVLAYCSSNCSKGEARGIRGRWWISGFPGRNLFLSYAPSLLVRICATSVPVSNGAEVEFGGVQRGGGADGGADAKRARTSRAPHSPPPVGASIEKGTYRRIRAGTYPPPPIAIMRFGANSARICSAAFWHSLWTCGDAGACQ